MLDTDLWLRLLLLASVLTGAAALDWRRHRAAATRWHEYGFLIGTGFVGGMLGVAVDYVTASLSPVYFTLGKGIAEGPTFRGQVTLLGLHAGLLAGLMVGGCLLLANQPRSGRPTLPYRQLIRLNLIIVLAALGMAPVCAVLAVSRDPLGFRAEFESLLSESQITRFGEVWGAHLGLYLGGALGAVYSVATIRQLRRSVAAERP